ncbi:MAG: DUF5678 domain-containing protein [bacterium]|nr:DUF5678 domain-containing protein [bacterium]
MREIEHNWLAKHPEITQQYRGEYVAVIGEKIVTHGTNLDEVIDKAEKIEELPLVAKIPKDEVLIV